jgi:hypothetical protein
MTKTSQYRELFVSLKSNVYFFIGVKFFIRSTLHYLSLSRKELVHDLLTTLLTVIAITKFIA